jgi:hypothetical protein
VEEMKTTATTLLCLLAGLHCAPPYTHWQKGAYLVGDIFCINGECDTVYYHSIIDYASEKRSVVSKHGDTVFIKVSKTVFWKEQK